MWTRRRWSAIVAVLAGLTACQVPVAPVLPPPIEAKIDMPAALHTTAAIDDRIDEIKANGTISLIDPKNPADPLDDVVVATRGAQAGIPNFSFTFTSAIPAGYYLLEAYKFRPAGSAPLTVRTLMCFTGTAWKSVTPPDGSGRITLNALTTAISAIPYFDPAVFPSQVLEVLATDGSLPAGFTTVSGFDRATVARMADAVQNALVTGTDPTGGMVVLGRLNDTVDPGAVPVPYEVTPGVTTLDLIGAGLDTSAATANRVEVGPDGSPNVTTRQWWPSAVAAAAPDSYLQQVTAAIPADLTPGLYGLGLTRGGMQSNRLPIRAQGPYQVKPAVGGSAGAMAMVGTTRYVAFIGDDGTEPGIHVAELVFNSGTGAYSLTNETVVDSTAGATHVAMAVANDNIEILATFGGTSLKNYSRPVAGTTWTTTPIVTGGTQVSRPALRTMTDGTLMGGWLENFAIKGTTWPDPATHILSLGITNASFWDFIPAAGRLHVVWADKVTKALKYQAIDTPPATGAPLVLTSADRFVTSLAIGLSPANTLGVAYTAGIGSATVPGRTYYGVIDGTSPMNADLIYDDPLATGSRINLGFRPDGHPFVIWAEGNVHYLLHLAYRKAASNTYGLNHSWSDPLPLSLGEPLWACLLPSDGRHDLTWMDEHGAQMYYLPLIWK